MSLRLPPGARICLVMMSAIGDAVHALPVVTALKRHDPTIDLTWILQGGPARLVRGHPDVDEIVLFDRGGGIGAFFDLRRRLAGREFDLVLDLQVYLKASIVTALGSAADINVAVAHNLQYECTDVHVSFNGGGDVTAHERLQKILSLMDDLEIEVSVGIRGGGIVLSGAAHLESCHLGYRVYDMGELLKKLSAGYQRQRTAPGKQGGFEGDLRQAGGIGVIVDAINDQLATQTRDALVQHFGSRLVVRGSAETIDAVTEILTEMGWEPPKE